MIPRNRAIVWAAASFLLLARQHAHAQFSLGKGVGKSAAKTEKALPYRPPFSEVPFLLENAPANNPLAPPSFVQAPQYAFPGHEKRPGVSTIEGQMLYDLNDPPKTHYWWNVPLYALTGFPRDGIDWLFGVIGYVPAANLVATGAYEFSGAQFLMRSPDDVHGYGGAANANKHGWREGEGWGFFSIYRHTRFREVDQNLLAQWKKHNEQVEASLDQRNSQVTQYNATVENIRKAYCDKAIEDWKAGRYNDALGRLWSYCPQRPNDYPALACYIACCIQQASSGTKDAQWGEVETQRLLRDWQAGNLPLLIDTLRTDAGRRLNDLEVRYWLTWAYAEMGSHAEALKEARELSENPRTGLRGNLLYFEICAQRFQELDPSKKKEAESAADLLDRMQSAVVRMRVADQAGGASA
ncbi:MAG: hypothetical protein NTW86_14265, partial [Candidatus Sumerlaeota bacterium]|nr:hypothetical protein [Candidatus Sumerlaeota bacterium]